MVDLLTSRGGGHIKVFGDSGGMIVPPEIRELQAYSVNTFHNPHGDAVQDKLELACSAEQEKQNQLRRLDAFQSAHAGTSPAMLERLQKTVVDNDNVFKVLLTPCGCAHSVRLPTLCLRRAANTSEICKRHAVHGKHVENDKNCCGRL